jgi:hypothetical protein
MSTDFKKILLKDPRLMVTDQLAYAVKKGGQSIVSQRQSAIAQSVSSVNFNVQIPSEQTIVDRRVWIKSTVTLQFQCVGDGPAQPVLVYGQNIALAAFPFHQLASTVQATLNNNVTSINMKDVLPFLIRSVDSREVRKSTSSCPTKGDTMYSTQAEAGYAGSLAVFTGNYQPATVVNPLAIAVPNNSNGAFNNLSNSGQDEDLQGNGAYSGPNAYSNAPNTAIDAPVQLYYSSNNTSSGSWFLQGSLQATTGAGQVNWQNQTSSNWWQLVFTTVEPVLVQPFLWSDPVSNKQGIYGLQTIQLQYNLSSPNRAFRIASPILPLAQAAGNLTVSNLTIVNVSNSELIFKYITPHADDLLPARNVIPLLTYDRYFSNSNNPVIPANYATPVTISSNTYNLTQVPDKICIFLRKKQSLQTPTDNDWSPVISNISINWNNNAGLLSSATIQDLYYYSRDAGSNQTFSQYCGQGYGSQTQSSAFGMSGKVSTIGSYLMLDFATVIQLTESFYAPGSLGNFQLQFQLGIQNQTATAFPLNSLEIVLVVMNSGIMVTDRGQTSTYTGILTKSDVLDVSQTEPLSITDVSRMVGSGAMDKGRALPMKVCDMLRHAKNLPAKAVEVAKEAVSKMASRLM